MRIRRAPPSPPPLLSSPTQPPLLLQVEVISPSLVQVKPRLDSSGVSVEGTTSLPSLFVLELVVKDGEGIIYRIPPAAFVASVLSVYDKGAASVQDIPQLEKFVMEANHHPPLYPSRHLLHPSLIRPITTALNDSSETGDPPSSPPPSPHLTSPPLSLPRTSSGAILRCCRPSRFTRESPLCTEIK